MRLERITVQGLFGVFDHDVPLNLDEHITIVSGPNGFGKTVILRLIHALLTGNLTYLKSVPFAMLRLSFEDGTAIEATQAPPSATAAPAPEHGGPTSRAAKKRKAPNPDIGPIEICRVSKDGERTLEASPSPKKLPPPLLRAIDRHIPLLTLHGDVWRTPTGEEFSAEEVIAEHRERIPDALLAQVEVLPGMRDIQDAIHVQFISTQRLSASRMAKSGPRTIRSFNSGYDVIVDDYEGFYDAAAALRRDPSLAVVQYSEETAAHIKSLLERYAARSQELDRTFPERLLKQDRLPALAPDDLRRRLKDLEAKRATLVELGFLDREEQGISEPVDHAIRDKGDVLSVYVQDTEKKLSVFDEMAEKIGFFVKRINERFKYKKMAINRDKGFVFTSKIGTLNPEDLSSGEQHELVLLYELLFKVNRTWLVLIDEPEISLHVGWQENFVRDLQEVIKLSEVDIVVATHSPVIVGDHWGLTVELKGPENGSELAGAARPSA